MPSEMVSGVFTAIIKPIGGRSMPAIFDLLYREYCRARLAEMRKQQLLLLPQWAETFRDLGDDALPTTKQTPLLLNSSSIEARLN
jgi:hypothetical protein